MSDRRPSIAKKLINGVNDCVDEGLAGFVAVNDRLRLIADHRIVIRADYETHVSSGKVALLSGGGSGHEPTFVGFVGEGVLTAAVAGSVFASPPANNVLAAIRLLGTGNTAGTLVIVANYTGDRLSFGLAVERARSEGQRVSLFLVADDCALVSGNKAVGRRGLCGIVLAMKIAGSMAQDGFSLDDITSRLRAITTDLGTIGMCVSPCSVPGMPYTFDLGDDEMELGLGVHGEAGVARIKMSTAKHTVDVLFKHMTKEDNCSGLRLVQGHRVVLLVNNLGSTSQLEVNVVVYEAIRWLENKGLTVERVFVGCLMTSLDMNGISLTVLRVDDEILTHVDSPTSVPGWPRCYQTTDKSRSASRIESAKLQLGGDLGPRLDNGRAEKSTFELNEDSAKRFRASLVAASRSLQANRELLNDLDRGCGDGDCGSTLAAGAERVLACLESGASSGFQVRRPALALVHLSDICQLAMGGSSGTLYGIFFAAAAAAMDRSSVDDEAAAWRSAIVAGSRAIAKYGGAERGDRTMLDALEPLVDAWNPESSGPCRWQAVSVAARSAAEATSGMEARAGRATYVNASHWTRPDPGAMAIAIIVEAVTKAVTEEHL